MPQKVRDSGSRRAAARGVVGSVLGLLEEGATHVGVATDHVIESFRNAMWSGYKDGARLPEDLTAQFPVVEEALEALGLRVWAMVDLEADDALASAAAVAADAVPEAQVVICTPDKDLAQCVVGDRVVQLDRRRGTTFDEAGVRTKFGVDPPSIPDWLALVGDSADGYPGLKGWGAKSAAAVLRRYHHLEHIPRLGERWEVDVAGARTLANALHDQRDLAFLFRDLATLRVDRSLLEDVEALRWSGPRPSFASVCEALGAPRMAERAEALAVSRR